MYSTATTSTDLALQILADPSRRKVLRYLADSDGAGVSADALAEQVAGEAGSDGRSSAAVSLRHNHLPRLADAGLVEYDRRSGTVRYRSRDDVEALLEFVSERME